MISDDKFPNLFLIITALTMVTYQTCVKSPICLFSSIYIDILGNSALPPLILQAVCPCPVSL